MNFERELLKAGYELAEGQNDGDHVTQTWINEKTGRAIRVEWFPFTEVKP